MQRLLPYWLFAAGALFSGVLVWTFTTILTMPWEGVIYPNKANLYTAVQLGRFASLEACRNASLSALDRLGMLEHGTYECGKFCRRLGDQELPMRWHDGISYLVDNAIHICQETAR